MSLSRAELVLDSAPPPTALPLHKPEDREGAVLLRGPKGEVSILYKPSEKQREFHAAVEPNVLLEGSRGSGKSIALRWDAHLRAMLTPNFLYVILRRSMPELLKSHLVFIDAEMRALGGEFRIGDHLALYPNGSRGYYYHCQSEMDVENLLSAQFYWMGIDEATTFPWEVITKLAASVRVPATLGLTAMLRLTTNPLGGSVDEIWKYFVEQDVDPKDDPEYDPRDWRHIHVTQADNPHLDLQQYRKRFIGLPAHVRLAWLEGERTQERGLLDFSPSKDGAPYHVITEMPRALTPGLASILHEPWIRIFRAYDHGFDPDPAVCLWIAVIGRQVIVFREQLWYRTIAKHIAREIVAETGDLPIVTTYCDPSIDVADGQIQTIKETMEREGLPLECSVNNREHFAHAVQSALHEEASPGRPCLQILRPGNYGPPLSGCPYLIRTIPRMQYDAKRPMALARSRLDHAVVALAYFLMSHVPITQPAAPSRRRKWMQPQRRSRLLGRDGVRRQFYLR